MSQFFSNKKPSTFGRHYYTVNTFMKWLGHELNMKVRIPRTLPKYHEPTEIMKLYDKIKAKRTHKGCLGRDLMLIDVKCGSGLRAAEMAKLRPCDVHDKFLEVIGGKGGEDRRVTIKRDLASKLLIFTRNMDPYESIYKLSARSISNKIGLWAKKAGVDLSAHSLRHYYAEQLYYYSKDIQAVQMQLGHKSIATTERYLGLSQQQIQDAVDKLHLIGEEEEETPSSEKAVTSEVGDGEVVLDMTVPRQLDKSPERMEAVKTAIDKAFGKRIPGARMPGNPRLKELGPKIDKVFGSRTK